MSFPEGSNVWSKLVLVASVICVFCVAMAIFGVRGGAFDFKVASGLLESTFQMAAAVFCLALIIFIGESKSRLKTGLAMVILTPVLVGIGLHYTPAPELDAQGKRPKPLNDISTDTQFPPQYEAVIAIRPKESNSLIYPTEAPALQALRFPDIKPMLTDLSKDAAFERALGIVQDKGWTLVLAQQEEGRIEAVAETFFFGFKDDVVIRVKSQPNGSVVDIRSHSRQGKGDKGKNAARVRSFISAFQTNT